MYSENTNSHKNMSWTFFPKKSTQGKYDIQANIQLQKQLKTQIQSPHIGYARSPFQQKLLHDCIQLQKSFQNIKHFVHVGIGGSSLGPEFIIHALKSSNCSTQFFMINNIDPDEISEALESIQFPHALFYFVSKSGGTAETLSAMLLIINYFKMRGVEEKLIYSKFVFATDPIKSELRNFSKDKNIPCLDIPSDVGGRFSVLTPVGLFPALFAGINIHELIDGAHSALNTIEDLDGPLYSLTNFLHELKTQEGRSITVMMPYSSKLKYFGNWFTQLWAESLGKKLDLNGHIVHQGFTPLSAMGATDQHSQMQLFMEGPKDKVLVLIEVENFQKDFSLKNSFNEPSMVRLAPHRLSDLMRAELHGTLKALQKESVPHIHISIEGVTPYCIGQLIMFFQLLTGTMGILLNIDPFNQPGVESGKIYAYENLINQEKPLL